MQDITWKVGGKQGEGIDSTGEIFASVLHRAGFPIFAYRHFMSLIKGGHTNFKIRVAEQTVRYHGDDLDMLVAFDQRSIDENWQELKADGVVLYDAGMKEAKTPDDKPVRLCPVPLTELAHELGNAIMKNMVACGASAAMIGLDVNSFDSLIEDRFGKKGEKVVAKNKEAVEKGYQYFLEHYGQLKHLPSIMGRKNEGVTPRYYISGNEAVGVGALTGGCRFIAAYPITPATEILYWLLSNMPRYGGRIVQAEDEIAACIMAIGANYAGVRGMTSTSGPGLSLMMEALGLSGISETPLVIVDVQRGGPSTGLPTKTEQSDLNEMLYGSHGEIPRIVLAPSSIEECYYFMQHAFNLAEQYQLPVIVASDLYLGMSKQSVEGLDVEAVPLSRGKLVQSMDLDKVEGGMYKRYDLTVPDGISPRTIPGMPNGRYVALSNEHEETGFEIEDTETRERMMRKRMKKLEGFNADWSVAYDGHQQPELLLVGFGSVRAQMEEAAERLRQGGKKAAVLTLKLLDPFPLETVKEWLHKAARVIVVENNYTGQLEQLLHQKVGLHGRTQSCRKYNGDPMKVAEILAVCGQQEEVLV